MKPHKERGAIVIEATISLTAFVFALYMLLMVVNIYYIQSKVSVALNAAAKDLSQYTYLYFKLGLAGVDSTIAEGTEGSRTEAKKTIDGLVTMKESITGAGEDASNLNFDGMMDKLNQGYEAGEGIYDQYADALAEDPMGLIGGMAMMAADDGFEKGKSVLAGAMVKAFMKKNLVSSKGDDADSFLRRYHVINGMDGLSFQYTSFIPGGSSNYIQAVVSYDVRVVRLLDLDFKFHFRQAAVTNGWANGISLIHKETNVSSESGSVWNMSNAQNREAYIRNQERDSYPYIATDQGFDAYDNTDGKNEFMTVVPLDIDNETSADDIAAMMEASYLAMEKKVEKLDKEINVQDHNGKTHTVESDPDTRTYAIVVVVPDNASASEIQEAYNQLHEKYPDLEITVKYDYGHADTGEDSGGGSGDSGDSGDSGGN